MDVIYFLEFLGVNLVDEIYEILGVIEIWKKVMILRYLDL